VRTDQPGRANLPEGGNVYEIAVPVLEWLRAGQPTVLARTVDVQGFSARWPQDGLAVTASDGATAGVGHVLGGAAASALDPIIADALAHSRPVAIHELRISDAEAGAAGLSCGGSARVLVQPASDIPHSAWQAICEREAVCLATALDGPRLGTTTWFSRRTLAEDESSPDPSAVRWFGRGVCAATVLKLDAAGESLVTALWPVSRLLVVGDGLLASALEGVARLLEWEPAVVSGVDAAVAAVRELRSNDALIVLTHDRDVDGPVLAAALETAPGYIGALGSRRTQEARAGWLRDRGVDDAAIAEIHGPAGLDIGARTPGEIALSIASEIVSLRSGAAAPSLRDRGGPIHVDGLRTPPARYPAMKPPETRVSP
jgi:xanthine dehydrogenase accessory factor